MRLLTLGRLELRTDDGQAVAALHAQKKPLALLCYLAAREGGGFVQRHAAAALFWPDVPEERARAGLRNALYYLRGIVGADAIVTRGDDEIGVNPQVLWCDALAFEHACAGKRYEEALTLYRGPLLDGFLPGDLPDFADWLDQRRRTLLWQATDAARTLAEQASEENAAAAVPWVQRWLELSPYEEPAIRSLMHVLAQTGDRARALQAFEAWQARLQKELNASPSPDTVRMADTLRKRTFTKEVLSPQRVLALPQTRKLARPAVAVLAVVALIVAIAALARRDRPVADGTVAVLPFSYGGGSEHAYLRAGMAELLTTRLASAGAHTADARSVDARVEQKYGTAALDPKRGSEVARQLGVRYYVLGSVLEISDTVRVSAALYEGERVITRTLVSGSVAQLFQLSDRAANDLLRSLNGQRARMRDTESLPAMQAFMEGEKAYTAGRYAQAMAAYGRALSADGKFARAALRYSMAANWLGTYWEVETGLNIARENQAHLSDDDQLLLNAWTAHIRDNPQVADSLFSEYVRRHPENADGWQQLGEVRYHWSTAFGRSPDEAREPFERALAITPNEGSSLTHLLRLAGRAADTASVVRIANRLLAQKVDADVAFETRAILALTTGDTAALARVTKGSDLTPERKAIVAAVIAAAIPNPADIRALLYHVRGNERDALFTSPYYTTLSRAAAAAGRFKEADAALDRLARTDPALAYELRCQLALLPYRPTDPARARRLTAGLTGVPAISPARRLILAALLNAQANDTTAAAKSLHALDQLTKGDTSATRAHNLVTAELEFAKRRYGAAAGLSAPLFLTAINDISWMRGFGPALRRYRHAQSVLAQGGHVQALRVLTTFPDPAGYDIAFVPGALLLMGQEYERFRDPAAARRAYLRVAEMWRDADPELNAQRAQVHARLR